MIPAGLSTDQAPPLAVPLWFYAVVPLALLAAGGLLMSDGTALVLSAWLPRTIALVHVATIGILLSVMCGSLYQMIPVVIGVPVPLVRMAYAVIAVLALGGALLVFGLWTNSRFSTLAATFVLGGALVAFVAPVSVALLRARGGDTLQGMRIAVLSLIGLASLGLRLAWGHATGDMPGARVTLLVAHIDLALVGWVGGLLMAVSWRVVPMFYLTRELPARRTRVLAGVLGVSLGAVFVAALGGASVAWVAIAALPGAISVWVWQPIELVRLIRARKRRRRDPSLQFWWLSIAMALASLPLAVVAWLGDWVAGPPLFAWVAIFGWAGAAVHGMLTRIVPFLVWLHRFSALVGVADVPPMKRLLPDSQVRLQLYAHVAALALGALAIITTSPLLARGTGLLVGLTGALLGVGFAGVLYRAAKAAPR